MSKTKPNQQKKQPAKPTDKVKKTAAPFKKRCLVESIAVNIICGLLFLAFGYVAIMTIFQTCVIDPQNYGSEVILYQDDLFVINILCLAIFTAVLFKINKHTEFFAKVNIKYMEIGLFAFSSIIGLIWIFSVQSVPAADSYNIYETATQASQGIYTSLYDGGDFYNKDFYSGFSYYNCYPFQLGFVLISEIIYRIFGTDSTMPLQVINVLCVAAGYLAVAKITKYIFGRKKIEFIVILALAGCIQPVLFCTFVYGNIIGMCCALWASFFLIRYFQTSKYLLLIPCGVLLVVSALAKYNNLIYLVAFVIMLIIHTVKEKKWQSVAFALALCIAVVGTSNLVIKSYEVRANTEFKGGVSQVLYLDMGLNESYMAPGWYNNIALSLYTGNNCDIDAAQTQAWSQIDSRLNTMSSDFDYTINFFGNKILSQWNEPTYESIWVSKVKSHNTDVQTGLGKAVYDGSTGQFLELYFNFYMSAVFILFTLGIYFMFLHKKTNVQTVLLPLVLLGGFSYHLLFEGKSQYVLTYIILLLPYAAYALCTILESEYTGIKNSVNKLKTIPDKEPKSFKDTELYGKIFKNK
ncbi:glycosyltransferase family 39 protein, partial [Ruminococcus sp.]|uniref:glycosyltransferase family 39 protein n=1 Tax=Ruminococcus sp. TaxID=41978 RepID=UPI0038643367